MSADKSREIHADEVEGALDSIDFIAAAVGGMLEGCGAGQAVANGALCSLTAATDTIRAYLRQGAAGRRRVDSDADLQTATASA